MSRAEPASAIRRRGLMLVLSSPSGAGKSTITRALLERDPGLALSISVTTRPQRPGEVEGRDYYFIDDAVFDAMVRDGQLLEHAKVFGNRYGTPREAVEAALAAGRDVVFDIDWQGTQQLKAAKRDDLVSIFVLPPTAAELERRLRERNQDSEAIIRGRMAKASAEMSHWAEYDYVIVNREIEDSLAKTMAILSAERLKRDRQIGLFEFVEQLKSQL